ncbi:MAG: competence/damage-inducible protein A [Anaerolineae bacterium]|nr:competence/damage-inducible protein A [Anaerolineae bacterium]
MNANAELLVIGNEILDGDVLDTNSHWLCQQLTGLGMTVARVWTVRDDLRAIVFALRTALDGGAGLIIATGGLGPTEDDGTLQAVAEALGRELARHPQAYAWVHERYQELTVAGHVDSAEMTPSRAKMANLPVGASPLPNRVGTAPGVLLQEGDATLVCLPGVPAELEHIYEEALRPVLNELLGEGYFLEWRAMVQCVDESMLAPVLQRVVPEHPDVYIKSRAKRLGEDPQFRITLSSRGRDQQSVKEAVSAAWNDLRRALEETELEVVSVEQVR